MIRKKRTPSSKRWYLYIIECRTKELYIGISNDVKARVNKHNQGKACRYTKYRHPVRLLYTEYCGDMSAARLRENEVKRFPREKKLEMVYAKRREEFLGF